MRALQCPSYDNVHSKLNDAFGKDQWIYFYTDSTFITYTCGHDLNNYFSVFSIWHGVEDTRTVKKTGLRLMIY